MDPFFSINLNPLRLVAVNTYKDGKSLLCATLKEGVVVGSDFILPQLLFSPFELTKY